MRISHLWSKQKHEVEEVSARMLGWFRTSSKRQGNNDIKYACFVTVDMMSL